MGETSVEQDRANTFPWPPLLLVAVIAGAYLLTTAVPLPWPGVDDVPARVIGLGFGAAGLLLIGWAVVALIKAGTTVLPDATSTVLVTTGPFARFRNPIYLGEALVLLSLAEITKSLWFVLAAAVFVVLVTKLQIVPEERHLEAQFGDAYRNYKSRSRQWI